MPAVTVIRSVNENRSWVFLTSILDSSQAILIDIDGLFFRRRSASGSSPGLAGCYGEAPAAFHLSHAREGRPEGASGGVRASLHPAVRRDRHYRWDRNPVVYQSLWNFSPFFVIISGTFTVHPPRGVYSSVPESESHHEAETPREGAVH